LELAISDSFSLRASHALGWMGSILDWECLLKCTGGSESLSERSTSPRHRRTLRS
jgi:hypothetical protein